MDLGSVLGKVFVGRGLTSAHLGADLAVVGRSMAAHFNLKIAWAAAGVLAPSFLVVLTTILGIGTGVTVPAIAALLLAAACFWIPDVSLAHEAGERRSELRRALACLLDLVSMSLAGGRGVPEALPSAARIGSGWAFELFQDTIERARYVGTTPWDAFATLGEEMRVAELQDLGGALRLVADDGAKVRDSLTARASTLRRRQLAETEGEAARADQSVQLAQVILALGFFLFLGYPAVVAVMGL